MKFVNYLRENKVSLVLSLVFLVFIDSLLYKLGNDLINIGLVTLIYLLITMVSIYLSYMEKRAYLGFIEAVCEKTGDEDLILEILARIGLMENKLYGKIIKNIDKNKLEINIDIKNKDHK